MQGAFHGGTACLSEGDMHPAVHLAHPCRHGTPLHAHLAGLDVALTRLCVFINVGIQVDVPVVAACACKAGSTPTLGSPRTAGSRCGV